MATEFASQATTVEELNELMRLMMKSVSVRWNPLGKKAGQVRSRLTRNVRVDLINGTYADARDQQYAYDGLHRLVSADQGTLSGGSITAKNFAQDWTLDQLGNWPTFKERDTDTSSNWDFDQSREHNEVNELTEFTTTSWVDPVHDAAGNMTTMPQPQAPSSSFTLKYDAWNRMVEVRDGSNNLVQTNEYDGLGQRIVRVNAVPSTDVTYDYYYNDQWQLLTEVLDGDVEAVYHWHPFYIDALAVRMRASDTHFFLQDANFNVTAAVDDDGNAVAERYAYSPYGEVTVLNPDFSVDSDGTDIGNMHFYTGRERDPDTSLQLNRHRNYASHLGRWTSRDPIVYGGGRNIYAYVGDTPIALTDWPAPQKLIQML